MLEVRSSLLAYPEPILLKLAHSASLPTIHQYHGTFPKPPALTAMVTSNDVPSTCFMCAIEPTSCAWKVRRILKVDERMRTVPSWLPRNRFSEPEQQQLMSLFSKKDLLSSSGALIWLTSKKSNVFH